MTFFSSAIRSLQDALVRSGRIRARNELLRMSPRTLEDAGFSLELLETGVHAWPWRTETAAPVSTGSASDASAAEIRRAERELQNLSDRELDDLAIARVDIPRAVRQGRAGIDTPVRKDGDMPIAA